MNRPYIVCHMMVSLDGKIDIRGWDFPPFAGRELAEYCRVAKLHRPDAMVFGRATVSENGDAEIGVAPRGLATAPIPRTTYRAAPASVAPLAFIIDGGGKLLWERGVFELQEGDALHVVAVLTEQVDDDYLAYLRERDVSYMFAGRHAIDIDAMLAGMRAEFGVARLVVGGGGRINGSFLDAGRIDELSILTYPVVDGRPASPGLFEGVKTGPAAFAWFEHTLLDDGVTWNRYRTGR